MMCICMHTLGHTAHWNCFIGTCTW